MIICFGVLIVSMLIVILLSSHQAATTKQEKMWSKIEVDNSCMYEYEPLKVKFYSLGQTRHFNYNISSPIFIEGYRLTLNNGTRNFVIAYRTDLQIVPYEEVELFIDLKEFVPGTYKLNVLIYPFVEPQVNSTSTNIIPVENYNFDIELLVEVTTDELLMTLYIFFIPAAYIILTRLVNIHVNKQTLSSISFFSWLTLGNYFYLLKYTMIYLFFFTNTDRTYRKKTRKLREKAENKQKKKTVTKRKNNCSNCGRFLSKNDIQCPRCNTIIN